MFWISFAKKAGRIFGRTHNVYTDKEAKIYRSYIYRGQFNVTLGEFSAGAILGLLLGLGFGLIFGLAAIFYIGLPMFPLIFFFPVSFGLLLFFVFRRAPYYAYRTAVSDIERNLAHFMPFLRGCAASGIPLEQIFDEGSRGTPEIPTPFGHLSRELGKIMDKNMYLKNLTKAITASADEIDSDFYRRTMGHIIHIRETGAELLPNIRPEEQPLAKAMKALSDEEIDRFKNRCDRYILRIDPLMDISIVICITFPVLMLILAIAGALSGRVIVPLSMLKLFTGFIFPGITLFLIALLAKWEPR